MTRPSESCWSATWPARTTRRGSGPCFASRSGFGCFWTAIWGGRILCDCSTRREEPTIRIGVSRLDGLEKERDSEAAADAQRREPAAGTPPTHLVDQRRDDAGAGGADRMA